MFNSLQQREIFHLEFLRWFTYKIDPKYYALKGGVNIRFFFGSIRYSEDMDIDLRDLRIDIISDYVSEILNSKIFVDNLRPYGIQRISIQDMAKAKQTETTQRFKIHLITFAKEDLFTNVEFSRRGLDNGVVVNPVSNSILKTYKLIPLIVSHYNAISATMQKLRALALRPSVQARDIFDLYILSSRYLLSEIVEYEFPDKDILEKAYENLFSVKFKQFSDSVVSYLSPEEQANYNSELFWDEIRLTAANLIEGLLHKYE